MLNKLKEIFTPDKVINRGKEWPDERQGTLPTDWQPSDDVEVSENKSSDDVEVSENMDALLYATETVGYDNREQQWNIYKTVTNFTNQGDSILDFGCGRGDYKLFYSDTYKQDVNYIGIDMNRQLIDAGLQVYENKVNLICTDWFTLDKKIIMDWSINVNSNNLRYDANIKLTDDEYLKDTIQTMYDHCNKGVIIMLDSRTHNPGNIFNWAIDLFGTAALDHSFSVTEYVLVIYK